MKTQIGVGVLSFPFTLQVLGLVPEILCFLAIAGMTTCERDIAGQVGSQAGSDIYIGHFKLKHPELCKHSYPLFQRLTRYRRY